MIGGLHCLGFGVVGYRDLLQSTNDGWVSISAGFTNRGFEGG